MWLLFTSPGWLIIGQRRRPKWTKCINAPKWTWLWSTGEGKQTAGAPVLKVSMACQIEYITLCCPVHFAAFHETLIRSNEGEKRNESAGRWFQNTEILTNASKLTMMTARVCAVSCESDRLWAGMIGSEAKWAVMQVQPYSAYAFFTTLSDKLVLPANQKQR